MFRTLLLSTVALSLGIAPALADTTPGAPRAPQAAEAPASTDVPLGYASGTDHDAQAAARQKLMAALFASPPPADADRLRALAISPDPLPVWTPPAASSPAAKAEPPAPPAVPAKPEVKAEAKPEPAKPAPPPKPVKTVPGLIGTVVYPMPDKLLLGLWEFGVSPQSWPMNEFAKSAPSFGLRTDFPVSYTGTLAVTEPGAWALRFAISAATSLDAKCEATMYLEGEEIAKGTITGKTTTLDAVANLPETGAYAFRLDVSCTGTVKVKGMVATLTARRPGRTMYEPAPVVREDRPLASPGVQVSSGTASAVTISKGGAQQRLAWLETVTEWMPTNIQDFQGGNLGTFGATIGQIPHKSPSVLTINAYPGGIEEQFTGSPDLASPHGSAHSAHLSSVLTITDPGRWAFFVALESPSSPNTKMEASSCWIDLAAEQTAIIPITTFGGWYTGRLGRDNTGSLGTVGVADLPSGDFLLNLDAGCYRLLPQTLRIYVMGPHDATFRPFRADELRINVKDTPQAIQPGGGKVDYTPGGPGTLTNPSGQPSIGAGGAGLLDAAAITAAIESKGEVALTINFDFNSDKIAASSLPQIREAAAAMARLLAVPGAHGFEVQGHTDNVGADDYNLGLSKRRATSVANELVKLGIEPRRLSPVGLGASQPVAGNDSDLGRALNRRVVLKRL